MQSAPGTRPTWLDVCLDSVEDWALRHGMQYQLEGDELFARLPDWYREKLTGRTPIQADLARLLWIRALHEAGHEWVLWLDADTLVIEPGWCPRPVTHTQFGKEHWLQRNARGHVSRNEQPHNAYVLMHRSSPVRDFLIYAIESLIERVDGSKIAPQMVGPKLLKALHNLVAFDLEPEAGALSPDMITALLNADDRVQQKLLAHWPAGQRLALANLCRSLDVAPRDRDQLARNPGLCSRLWS